MSKEDYEIRCRLTPVDKIEEEEDDDDSFPCNVLCLQVVAKFMHYRSRLALQEQEDGDHDDELQLYDSHCYTVVSKLLLRCEELVSEEESSRSAMRFCLMVSEIPVRPFLIERIPDDALQMVQDERYLCHKFPHLRAYIDIPPRNVYNYGSNIDLLPKDVYYYGSNIDLPPMDVYNYGSHIDLPPRGVYNYGRCIDLPPRGVYNYGRCIDLPPRDVYKYGSDIDLPPRDGSDIDLPPRDVYNYGSDIDLPPRDVSNDGSDETDDEDDEDDDDEELHLVPASKSSIEALERVRAAGSASNCTICLEEISNGSEATRMPCYHLYHSQCICDWLEISGVCPLCRFEIE